MPLIDNREQTLQDALKNSLTTADRVDILTAFFYFSGFKLLASELKDKKLRILVGKYIDPKEVGNIMLESRKNPNFNLEKYEPRGAPPLLTQQKKEYVDSFVELFNKSALYDSTEDQDAYKIFEQKLRDGSLEIKLCAEQNHAKAYVLHNKEENSQNGDALGVVISGSSNFTFQGLQGQGELNQPFRDNYQFILLSQHFEKLWANAQAIDIHTVQNNNDFLQEIEKRLWIHSVPEPYKVYIRILHELFGKELKEDVKSPLDITSGQFLNLEYQLDAIRMGIDRIKKYDGVIIADVVGLGKSIISAAIAYNMNMPTVIIAPPHLKSQWVEYQAQFRLPGTRVFSSGIIKDVYAAYSQATRPTLFIIDEAHHFRNEDTDDYKLLHQIVRSHPENKVIVLTATPFNNRPEDVFALIKLFQTPSRSTIRSVDNLGLRFRALIDMYKQLQTSRRKNKDPREIDKQAREISDELRRLIEMVVIRRSRLDLMRLTRYREDLKRQKIDFANIIGPELLEYDLGNLTQLYIHTLNQITGETSDNGFIGARYKPTSYLKDEGVFREKYGQYFDDTDLKTAQSNLSVFMRRLLVTRFESSTFAFQSTLENMIASNQIVERWWTEVHRVPIMKKGNIPDPEVFQNDTNDNIFDLVNGETGDEEIQTLKEQKGLLTVERELFDEKFIDAVRADIDLLKYIYDRWFGNEALHEDPKRDNVITKVKTMLAEHPQRKIIIFSSYADTTEYLYQQCKESGLQRILCCTAKSGTKQIKKIIRENFDAGIPDAEQKDDYDVLIATDAFSEGINLHRAGVVINYDIPYNPTRVIQRIGRINRINKRVYENIYIYNCFPSAVGETEIGIKQISTLKIKLINNVIGNDTKTLTNDEELKSFFKEEFRKAEAENEEESWDVSHREVYDAVRRNPALLEDVMGIPERARLTRINQPCAGTVAFAKKGDHVLFALKKPDEKERIVSVETAISFFAAQPEEKAQKGDESLDHVFIMLRDALFAEHEQPSIRGRRADALKNLKYLRDNYEQGNNFCRDLEEIIRQYDDLSEGELKDIAQLPFKRKALPEILADLQQQFSLHYMQSIKERAERLENEDEIIVITEELRV